MEHPHLSQSSKQVTKCHVNLIHWYIVRSFKKVAEYQVNVSSSMLSNDLFCNKQMGGKSLQRRESCGREETKL